MSHTADLLIVQHQDECPPALFADWLTDGGLSLDVRRPYRGEPLPVDLLDHAGLVVLGGSMGAHDDGRHQWLAATKRLLRDAAEAGRPVLGICLGHQLGAVALGGRSEPNPRGQTVGVRPVGWLAAAADDPLFGDLARGQEARVPHWNTDVVVRLPAGCDVLGVTDDGAPQVLRLGERAWGVQFHPEVDHELVSLWAEEDRSTAAERGLDIDAALQDLKESQAELHATGRRVARAFARVARDAR